MIWSSISPYSAARCAASVVYFAAFSAELIEELFSNAWLALLAGLPVIVAPLKALIHPTFGQTCGVFATLLQNFVYMTACSTGCSWTLNPSAASCALNT